MTAAPDGLGWRARWRARPPSAALLLGVASGALAAVTVLPTALPLSWRLQWGQEAAELRHVATAAQALANLGAGSPLPPTMPGVLDVAWVARLDDAQRPTEQHGAAPLIDHVPCEEDGEDIVVDLEGTRWALACRVTDAGTLAAADPSGPSPLPTVLGLVGSLAGIVGIVTALGVLRLLAPLSRVSRALTRVGAGERGVRLDSSGLRELDDLVDRLNAAAAAMQDREEAILTRIQAVQEMSRMVAHEVRNPLQSLELLSSLIATEEDPAERARIVGAIHQEIRALDLVVERVLRQGAARGTGLKLQRTRQSVRPLLDHALALRGAQARANGVELAIGSVVDTPVEIDAALVGRSLENLVLNALQAVGRNGKVVMSAFERFVPSPAGAGSELWITVDDNGPGVAEEIGAHVWEANVSGRTGGTGLGLALVKEVIEAHGGYVFHEPSPLGGARFAARLPIGEVTRGGEGPEPAGRRR